MGAGECFAYAMSVDSFAIKEAAHFPATAPERAAARAKRPGLEFRLQPVPAAEPPEGGTPNKNAPCIFKTRAYINPVGSLLGKLTVTANIAPARPCGVRRHDAALELGDMSPS